MRNNCLRSVFHVLLASFISLAVAGNVSALTYDADGSVTLQWQANAEPDLAGYNLYRSTQSGGPYTILNSSPIPGTSFSDTQTANGATYYYAISAVDQVGNESGHSPESDGCRVDTSAPTIWASPNGGQNAQCSEAAPSLGR